MRAASSALVRAYKDAGLPYLRQCILFSTVGEDGTTHNGLQEKGSLSYVRRTSGVKNKMTRSVWKRWMYKQDPQSARRNNSLGGQISRWFLLLSEDLSASNYPGAAYNGPSTVCSASTSATHAVPSLSLPV